MQTVKPLRRKGLVGGGFDTRHPHHSLSQQVINRQKRLMAKLCLPWGAFVCDSEDRLGVLYMRKLQIQKWLPARLDWLYRNGLSFPQENHKLLILNYGDINEQKISRKETSGLGELRLFPCFQQSYNLASLAAQGDGSSWLSKTFSDIGSLLFIIFPR